jgi:predicted 3-demethylubiquinone-9 3-methyltransferase (glyoxalase superfamily)
MAIAGKRLTPCLWFDTQAEEAAKFYCSVFKNSKIGTISRYPEAGQEIHHKPAGSVMVVAFELDGSLSPRSTAGRISSSTRRCRSRSCATRRTRSITTGIR